MNGFRCTLCVLLCLSGTGCHFIRGRTGCHAAQPYLSAQQRPPLKLPPGADAPASTTALVIPTVQGTPVPRGPNESCLEEPPRVLAKPLPKS